MTRPATAVRFTAVAVSGAYTLALFLSGAHIDTLGRRLLAYLPLAAGACLAAWDLLGWRLPVAHRLHSRPRIDGTWIATLQPTEDSHVPAEGNRGPIRAYLVIRQTYWGLRVTQFTEESTSVLRSHFWTNTNGGPDQLVYTYENVPLQVLQHRSPRHYGTSMLSPANAQPVELTGYYFTDRYTKGDMTLRLHDRTTGHPSFDAVRSHCGV